MIKYMNDIHKYSEKEILNTYLDNFKQYTLQQIIDDFYCMLNRSGNLSHTSKIIIEHLSRENYAKKYFYCDYYFWDMYDYFLHTYIPDGEKLYKERNFDKIIDECKKTCRIK